MSLLLWERMGGPRRGLLCLTQLKGVGESKKAPWQELTMGGNPHCSRPLPPSPVAHLQSVPAEEVSAGRFSGQCRFRLLSRKLLRTPGK